MTAQRTPRPRVDVRRARDRGAAALWVLVCAAVLVAVAGAVVVRSLAVLARHRVEGAADLAALAGAGRIGVGGDPCAAARAVAGANRARLLTCVLDLAPDGRSGTVVVRLDLAAALPVVGMVRATAGARAARLPSDTT